MRFSTFTGAVFIIAASLVSVNYVRPEIVGKLRSLFDERALAPSGEVPTSRDSELLSELGRNLPGKLVFDSNRGGTFGIYSISTDGADLVTVYDSEFEDLYPDPDPQGNSLIVFAKARTKARDAASDIWTVSLDSQGSAKQLVQNGTFPTFSSDGDYVYFERERRSLFRVDRDGKNLTELFPADIEFGNFAVIKPRVSPDRRYAAFISDKQGRWNTWLVDFETKQVKHVQRGCEPTWFSDSQNLAWIKTDGALQDSGVYKFSLQTQNVSELHDGGPPRGHEYFPTLAANDRFLLFAACRENEHSHTEANYQLFVRDLGAGTVARLTFDKYTNRWPKFIPSIQTSTHN